MAKKFYQDTGNSTMALWTDPGAFVLAELVAKETLFAEIAALSDETRTFLAAGGLNQSFADLAAFDTLINDELEAARDRQDYFSYVKADQILDTFDHAWIVPEAVESFGPDELAGNVATNAIDGDNQTVWRSTTAAAQLTCRIRNTHKKRIDRIRLRHATATPIREQLAGINVRMARNLTKIDDAASLITTASPTWVAGWVEIPLPTKVLATYIKLDGYTSGHASQSQIRELQVRAIVREL